MNDTCSGREAVSSEKNSSSARCLGSLIRDVSGHHRRTLAALAQLPCDARPAPHDIEQRDRRLSRLSASAMAQPDLAATPCRSRPSH